MPEHCSHAVALRCDRCLAPSSCHSQDQKHLNNRSVEVLKLLRGLVLRLALIFRSMEHSLSQASSSSKPAMATSLSDVTGRAETARGSHGKPLRPRPSRRSKATQQSHFGTPQTPSRPGSQACTDLQVNGAFHIPGILIIKTGHGHQFI